MTFHCCTSKADYLNIESNCAVVHIQQTGRHFSNERKRSVKSIHYTRTAWNELAVTISSFAWRVLGKECHELIPSHLEIHAPPPPPPPPPPGSLSPGAARAPPPVDPWPGTPECPRSQGGRKALEISSSLCAAAGVTAGLLGPRRNGKAEALVGRWSVSGRRQPPARKPAPSSCCEPCLPASSTRNWRPRKCWPVSSPVTQR